MEAVSKSMEGALQEEEEAGAGTARTLAKNSEVRAFAAPPREYLISIGECHLARHSIRIESRPSPVNKTAPPVRRECPPYKGRPMESMIGMPLMETNLVRVATAATFEMCSPLVQGNSGRVAGSLCVWAAKSWTLARCRVKAW